MTTVAIPPTDLSPRVASDRVEDFPRPTGREEEWRFAPMDLLARFLEPEADAVALRADETAGVRTVPAADAAPTDWLPTDRPSAVARSGASEVVEVRVPADASVEEPIVVRLGAASSPAYGHVDVRVGAHSRSTIVVIHDASIDASGAMVVDVGDGAELTMLAIVDGPAENVQLWHWHADIGRDARFTGAMVTLGGRVVRVLPSVAYRAPGGSAELLGAFLADGEQYLEHRIFVDHAQPHCSSRVSYKGALSGAGAHTVWIGDVLVRREAVGVDTYELNRNLLLDDGPRADSVPNLELETGDVLSAGHASATGRFDDEQLFYLQSRGIPELLARQLVVRGFFVDVLARIDSASWREQILERISARLGMTVGEQADGEVA